jgi:hypothetical protein
MKRIAPLAAEFELLSIPCKRRLLRREQWGFQRGGYPLCVLFARGYGRGAAGRATGFGLTAYPTFGMLAALALVLLLQLLKWIVG